MVWSFFLADSIHGYNGRRRPPLHSYVEKALAVVDVDDENNVTDDLAKDGNYLAALLLLPPDAATVSTATTGSSTTGSAGANVFDNSLSSSTLSSSVSSFAVDYEIEIELDDGDGNDNEDEHHIATTPIDSADVSCGSAPQSCVMSDRTDTEEEEEEDDDGDTEVRQDEILESPRESLNNTCSGSHSSSNKKTGRTSSRHVHFYARATVNTIPSLDTLTVDERTAMYYASHEYREMKQDVHKTLDVLIQQQYGRRQQQQYDMKHGPYCHNDYYKHRHQHHPREEVSYCFDGLYTPEEYAFRDEAMVQSLCAVMSEQQFQWDNNDHYDDDETETGTTVVGDDDDPSEYIARAYIGLEVHHESTIRARHRALRIASEVIEEEERQEAKWLAELSSTSSSSSLSEESSQKSSQHSCSADDTADENDHVNNSDETVSLQSPRLSQPNEDKDTVQCHQRIIYKAPKPLMLTMMHLQETHVNS